MATQKNSTLNIRSSTKKLFRSIRKGKKSKAILALIQKGADVNARNSKGYSPLLLASKKSMKTVVNLLIDSGAIVDGSACRLKRTLLHYASGYGWIEMVQSLVKQEPLTSTMINRECPVSCKESTSFEKSTFPNIHEKDMEGRTALHLASYSGHLEVVKCLVEQGADITAKDEIGETALHEASSSGQLEIVKFILEKGASLDAKNGNGRSALHRASSGGQLEVVKYLVEKGAELDVRDDCGETALHKASRGGYIEVVEYFLNKGADMEVKSRLGVTPLLVAVKDLSRGIAVEYSSVGVIALLMNRGANVDYCDAYKRTVLHYASQIGWIEMVRYLVKGVPIPPFILNRNSIVSSEGRTCPTIHARDMFGRTALHDAASNGHLEIVKFFVEEGADINVKSCKGVTPLLVAARFRFKDIVDLLVNSEANLDGCDENKCTVLHYASREGWIQIVQSFVRRGYDLDAITDNGKTAFAYACIARKWHIAEYLLKAGSRWDIQNNNGNLPLNFWYLGYPSIEFISLVIAAGAYLMPVDYHAIENDLYQQKHLRDVTFCWQAIVNKFNAHDLPALYKLPVSASLPSIEKMIITSNSEVARTIERTVKQEIQTNGHCNVLEVRPMMLSSFSVRSLLEYYDTKKKSVLQKQSKMPAESVSANEYQHLNKSMCYS